MSEYIERGALLKAIGCENAVKYGNKSAEQQHKSYSSMMLYEIADEINDAPAADVEPVVRARWQDGKCTNCDCFGFPRPDGSNEYTIRCPNCGAHMERSGSGE